MKFFGSFALGLRMEPGQAVEIEVPPQTTLSELIGRLGLPAASPWIALVNGVRRPPEESLKEGDEIAVFPPLGGGA